MRLTTTGASLLAAAEAYLNQSPCLIAAARHSQALVASTLLSLCIGSLVPRAIA